MRRHRQTAVERLAGQKDLPFAPCPFPRAAARFFVTTDTAAGKPHLTVVGKHMLCDRQLLMLLFVRLDLGGP